MGQVSVHNANDAEPIGTIVEVHGPVVLIRCEPLPPLSEALITRNGGLNYTFEVYQHIDREHIRAITLENPAGLRRGMKVYDCGAPLSIIEEIEAILAGVGLDEAEVDVVKSVFAPGEKPCSAD